MEAPILTQQCASPGLPAGGDGQPASRPAGRRVPALTGSWSGKTTHRDAAERFLSSGNSAWVWSRAFQLCRLC